MTFRSDDAPCGRYESELRADYPAAMTLPEVLALAILELRTRARCMELVRPVGVDEGRKRTDDDRDILASEVERMQGEIDDARADLERERLRTGDAVREVERLRVFVADVRAEHPHDCDEVHLQAIADALDRLDEGAR